MKQRIEEIMAELKNSDGDMSRILEDILSILVKKGAVSMHELSDITRDKLERREKLRKELRDLVSQVA